MSWPSPATLMKFGPDAGVAVRFSRTISTPSSFKKPICSQKDCVPPTSSIRHGLGTVASNDRKSVNLLRRNLFAAESVRWTSAYRVRNLIHPSATYNHKNVDRAIIIILHRRRVFWHHPVLVENHINGILDDRMRIPLYCTVV